jgi:hypothetical protein
MSTDPLTLKPRQSVDEAIECWDDDGDLQGIDDLNFRNVSSTTVGSTSHHRDSVSSRMSTRSDRESVGGGDEDWQVLLPADDDKLTADAIKSAMNAGIPIPTDVPSSALLGGTIKRLGGRRLQKVLGDDWGEDIELPSAQDGGLKLKKSDAKDRPDAMRQFSAEFPTSPQLAQPQTSMTFMERMASATKSKTGNASLDKFRDAEDDDFFGDVPTIKVAKNRTEKRPINFIPPPHNPTKDVEVIEDDFELPNDGQPLRLSRRKETPMTPVSQQTDDLDMEWAEGSLGTRFGGTRRDARSNPSSSISAFSPSASSCLTGESEDEGLEGLVLPEGPLRLDEALKKRREHPTPGPLEHRVDLPTEPVKQTKPAGDDFFSGIEIGDGQVFDSGKLTLNPKIVHKEARKTSPARRPATTLTFTNKMESNTSKIPKPRPQDRNRSALEPVSESGGPVNYRRPGSRMGHSAQSSLSAIPTPSTPSSHHIAAPSTPVRRGLNNKSSRDFLRSEPTTNPSQYLKAKRSAPVMRSQPSPARSQPTYQRPPSRGGDYGSRQAPPPRPKTPVERLGADSSLAISRKAPVPFLPAGNSHAQSHHVNTKSSRNFRPGSSDSNENAPVNRPISRLTNVHHRPTTPTGRHAPESLTREAASKRTLTKPTRRRAFGDGNELDAFDDLPTSATTESKFTKQPIARGAPKSVQMRSKLGFQSHNTSTTSVNELQPPPTPSTPLSPKHDPTPRFARDTNASRLAREHRMGSVSAALHSTTPLPTVREGGPLSSISTNRKTYPTQTSSMKGLAAPTVHQSKKRAKGPPQKPNLIRPMGDAINSPKQIGDMQWNPQLHRWEGNENDLAHALAAFDAPNPSPAVLHSPKSPLNGKAAPALIANVGATKGVQMQNGMVFDPHRMCWLKAAPRPGMHRGGSTSNPMSPDIIDEDDDPFAGLDDLEDSKDKKSVASHLNDDNLSGTTKNTGLVEDEWLVGEEFDVGPEFVRRQRAEEERWRTKVEGWVGGGVVRDDGGRKGGWRWAITKVL